MNQNAPSFVVPLSITFPLDQPGFEDPVTVTAATVEQLARMLNLALPLLQDLMGLGQDMLDRLVSPEGPTQADVVELLELLAMRPALATGLVSVATGYTTTQVGLLLPDRFAYLFAVVLQVNADFFGRALPALAAAGGKLKALLPGQPPQPQNTSSTAGPASSAS